mgnify:FL=1
MTEYLNVVEFINFGVVFMDSQTLIKHLLPSISLMLMASSILKN